MHHRITLESLFGRRPVVRACGNRLDAQQLIDQAQLDPDCWHILHETRQSEKAAPIIRLSLYRSNIHGWYAVRDSRPGIPARQYGPPPAVAGGTDASRGNRPVGVGDSTHGDVSTGP